MTNLQGLVNQGKILESIQKKWCLNSQTILQFVFIVRNQIRWIQLFKRELKENLGDFPNRLGEPQGKQNLHIP